MKYRNKSEPVTLKENIDEKYHNLDEKSEEYKMPFITPTYPQTNSTYNLSQSLKQIIFKVFLV